jgi:succinate dehydrogenase / fumarate reductase iron-sulfur subunit
MGEEIQVTVHRFNKEAGNYVQTYLVPLEENQDYSVLNVLEYIARNLDPTLAFFDHAACRQGACKKCFINIDGKLSLACTERVKNSHLELKPCNTKVLKDLVCSAAAED